MSLSIACLINNYNYATYLRAAIESALNQSRNFDEVIVVDDCSKDSSRAVLESGTWGEHFRAIYHERNKGQYAAICTAVLASTADIICLLDADDILAPDYVEAIAETFSKNPDCDFLIVDCIRFSDERTPKFIEFSSNARLHKLPPSVIATAFGFPRPYVGANTSRLAMRRGAALKCIDVPWPDDWRVSGDDCFVLGTSIAGVQKYWLSRPLVGYRQHSSNNWSGAVVTAARTFFVQLARLRMVEYFMVKWGIGNRSARLAAWEFKSIDAPRIRDLKLYSRMVLKYGAPEGSSRLRTIVSMARWLISSNLRQWKKS